MRIGKRARTATIQLLSGFFFFLIFVVSATSMQDLGGLARQERERRANLPRRSRVYTNEDLARPRIVDPEDRRAAEPAPNSVQADSDMPALEFPAPRPLVIDWPDDISLGDAARIYGNQTATEPAAESAAVAPPAPELPAPRSLVIDWPEDIPLAAVVRFTEDRRAEESAPSSVSVASDVPALELPAPRSLVIQWPEDIPLGDVARFYRKEREKDAAGMPAFAANEPSTGGVVLEPWLFPNPLASPLPTTLDSFFPPRGIAEPAWDAPQVPPRTVRVERGDTLWKIAARRLGSGNQWPKIVAANPALQDPNHIQPGQELLLPAQEVTPSGTQIRVQAGDSLWKLAATQLGTGHAWPCLAAANPQIEDANRIYPGQMLVVPATCSAS